MAALTINFTRGDHLADFDHIFAETATPELAALLEQGTGMAQARAPVDRSFFRNSIGNEVVETSPGVIAGQIKSTADPVVVEVIESGRAPGRFPPISVIEAWAGRKLGAIDPKNRRSIAFLIARKIATEGIPGKFVFKNTFQEMQPLIEQTSERVAAKVAARL
jgi:hypothetical protein